MEPKRAEETSVSGGKLRFDVYEADPHAGELRKYGYRIRLEDRPFRALLILLQHAQEVVTREELQKQLWPADVFVDFDHGLNTAIAKIRRALNDSADEPRFVETVGRRGYRFVAEVVTELQASSESSPPTSRNQVQQGNKPASGPTEDEALQRAAPARMRGRPGWQLRLLVVMAGMLVLAVGVIVLV
jgi:DNA-binding winged helix-turn-helix (wHTH) protein